MAQIDLFACFVRPLEGFYNSEVLAPIGRPLRTFLPTGYESNYPYPLLVFLHGTGSSEEQILRFAPRLSRRNYIAIALRGPHSLPPSLGGRRTYSWGNPLGHDTLAEDYIFRAVEQTCQRHYVHTGRIYLAGFREGAQLAYRLGLLYPDLFAGVIALNGCLPRRGGPLLHLPDVRQLRVLIGHGIANSIVPLTLAEKDYRLLYTAGLSVRMHTYPTNHRIHPHMLRDINRWIMEAIDAEG
jgi:phospholipase/carboxylesterase